MGSRNKFESDHCTSTMWLDRQLFPSARYPADYGYIETTLAEDGGPLDVLIAVDEPTVPGRHVRCRPLGVINMRDEQGADRKILATPVWQRNLWRELEDVTTSLLHEMSHFRNLQEARAGQAHRGPGPSRNGMGGGSRPRSEPPWSGSRRREARDLGGTSTP